MASSTLQHLNEVYQNDLLMESDDTYDGLSGSLPVMDRCSLHAQIGGGDARLHRQRHNEVRLISLRAPHPYLSGLIKLTQKTTVGGMWQSGRRGRAKSIAANAHLH